MPPAHSRTWPRRRGANKRSSVARKHRGGELMASVSTTEVEWRESSQLRWGASLMAVAGLAFIGYGIIFFIRNFSGDFLELGIGSEQVASSKNDIKAFDNDLYHYISHLHI